MKSCSARSFHLRQTSSSRLFSSIPSRKIWSRKKRSSIHSKKLLGASLFSNNGQEIFFLFWSVPISVAMKLSLLNHVVWNWEKWSYVCWMTPRFAALPRDPHVQSDDAFTPVWKAFFALRLFSLWPFTHFLTFSRIPCGGSQSENGSFEVFSLHTPSVAVDRRHL